ncbi:MAG: hypothetical protein V1913_18505 [Fibrobacterota bacterium]
MDPVTINPDHVCQRTLQAKMETYKAKEHFEAVLKQYNDEVENLVQVVGLMKNRILELERVGAEPVNSGK